MIESKMSMFNRTLPTWYAKYGMKLNEDASISFSDDTDERLKQYLDNNPGLIDEIQAISDGAGSSATDVIQLDADTYKVIAGDLLTLRIDKSDEDNPKIYLGVENDKVLVGDLNLNRAASFIYNSMDGWGTYEDEYANTMAAMHKSCADRGISQAGVDRVFDIFNKKAFGTKYEGATLEEWIDGDFDGRAEVCAMQVARLPIPKSIWRGIDWAAWGIDLGLILLAIPSFGGSLLAAGALKGGAAATKTANAINKVNKAVKGTKAAKALARAGKAIKGSKGAAAAAKVTQKLMAPLVKGWAKLSKAAQLRHCKKWMPKGWTGLWKTGGKAGGKTTNVKLINYYVANGSKSGPLRGIKGKHYAHFKNINKAGKPAAGGFTASLEKIMEQGAKGIGPGKEVITKISKSAGLSAAAIAALAAHKGESDFAKDDYSGDAAVQAEGEGPSAGDYAVAGGQALLNYDSTAADPTGAITSYREQTAMQLATQIHDAMDGWTSNSDELAIALMILSMDKVTASNLLKEWNDLYADLNFYENVIAGELESDMAEIVGAYWSAITGDGPKVSAVDARLAKISK